MKSGKPLEVEENNDFLFGLMMREDGGKEARFERKEELEGGEARKEVCGSPAEVGRRDVDRACRGSVQNNRRMIVYDGLKPRLATESAKSVRLRSYPDRWPNGRRKDRAIFESRANESAKSVKNAMRNNNIVVLRTNILRPREQHEVNRSVMVMR